MLFHAGNGYLKNEGPELIFLVFIKYNFIKNASFIKSGFIKPLIHQPKIPYRDDIAGAEPKQSGILHYNSAKISKNCTVIVQF